MHVQGIPPPLPARDCRGGRACVCGRSNTPRRLRHSRRCFTGLAAVDPRLASAVGHYERPISDGATSFGETGRLSVHLTAQSAQPIAFGVKQRQSAVSCSAGDPTGRAGGATCAQAGSAGAGVRSSEVYRPRALSAYCAHLADGPRLLARSAPAVRPNSVRRLRYTSDGPLPAGTLFGKPVLGTTIGATVAKIDAAQGAHATRRRSAVVMLASGGGLLLRFDCSGCSAGAPRRRGRDLRGGREGTRVLELTHGLRVSLLHPRNVHVGCVRLDPHGRAATLSLALSQV